MSMDESWELRTSITTSTNKWSASKHMFVSLGFYGLLPYFFNPYLLETYLVCTMKWMLHELGNKDEQQTFSAVNKSHDVVMTVSCAFLF